MGTEKWLKRFAQSTAEQGAMATCSSIWAHSFIHSCYEWQGFAGMIGITTPADRERARRCPCCHPRNIAATRALFLGESNGREACGKDLYQPAQAQFKSTRMSE